MLTIKSFGSVVLQSTKNKLISFSPTNFVITANEPSLAVGVLLQTQNIFDSQVRYRRSCIRLVLLNII